MINERIRAIHDAAVGLFLSQGYSKTQISHIAKAVGISVGTVYHDFIGKEEIKHFILKCSIEPSFLEHEFQRPITNKLFIGLEDEIIATFEASKQAFASRLRDAAVTYSFSELVSDAFDLLARYAVGCLFIEKNQLDCGSLAECYRSYRASFFNTMEAYLQAFLDRGALRPIKNVPLTTSLIIEILTWWAMDMRYIAFETQKVSLDAAKEVCLDNIIAAYQK